MVVGLIFVAIAVVGGACILVLSVLAGRHVWSTDWTATESTSQSEGQASPEAGKPRARPRGGSAAVIPDYYSVSVAGKEITRPRRRVTPRSIEGRVAANREARIEFVSDNDTAVGVATRPSGDFEDAVFANDAISSER